MKLKVLLGFLLISFLANAQVAQWDFRYEFVSGKPNQVDVFMDITIPKGFHMYSFDQAEGGPIAAEVSFKPSAGVTKIGTLQSLTKPHEKLDEVFGITTRDFSNKVTWKQRFSVNTKNLQIITGTYSYQLCQDDGMCVNPFPVVFQVNIPAQKQTENNSSNTESEGMKIQNVAAPHIDSSISKSDSLPKSTAAIEPIEEPQKQESMSLWWIFIAGFVGGLLAFVTPCVFPMVPMTVSMFIKRSKEKAKRDVFIYGASIVFIYVAMGLFITMVFGADALNKLSTNPWFNVAFFAIFVVFAISFFGAFELMLPTSWVNFMDKKADSTTGLLSIFFMAFTLVLVSFSCTAMIIGTLLVQSVVSGSLMGPFMGMLGFSIALALPFMLFAFFPSLLKSLPKSGGWLNSVKVVLGFIELALALKFLSNADLVSGWGILPRDLFLAIWIVIMILLGIYLLGKIRFAHDSEYPTISVTRFLLALTSFAFALYLLPGMFGAPLSSLSGYLPPASTQTFDLYTPTLNSNSSVQPIQVEKQAKKYADVFHCPHNLDCFFDYEEGLAYAKKVNKPVLLDFTGKACANCRKIEMNVWSKPEILQMISNDYVLISLYVDSREPLEKELVRTEEYAGKSYEITTIGEHWSMFMMKNYGGLMQPYYVILSPEGKRLVEPITYNEAQSVANYKKFLEAGIDKMGL